jgi:hypothetical protein
LQFQRFQVCRSPSTFAARGIDRKSLFAAYFKNGFLI